MDNLLLYDKLASLPENLKKEVSDFIDFLVVKNKQKSKKNTPIFGSGKGMFVMKPDFDEPLEDFKDYM
jgi:hypothetical protein